VDSCASGRASLAAAGENRRNAGTIGSAYPLLASRLHAEPMNDSRTLVDFGFDRLQQLLLEMHAGDVLTPADAARVSGLSPDVCRTVLQRLTSAGLMAAQNGDRYVRQTLDLLAS
jgi:hypothetical protein